MSDEQFSVRCDCCGADVQLKDDVPRTAAVTCSDCAGDVLEALPELQGDS